MVFLDDTGYYYTRHWNISSTMFVMLLRFVLCVLLRFRKNTQLATVGTHYCSDTNSESTESGSNEDGNSKNKGEEDNSNENNTKDRDTSSNEDNGEDKGKEKSN